MSDPVTIEEYNNAIPDCCKHKTEEAHRIVLMHCWGLLNSINKGVEIQKSISFEYFKDHTMDVITPGGSFSGTWSFSAETKEIFIRIDGSNPKDSTIMGKFEDGKIISNNETPVGEFIVIYVKE